jgi:putative FmdB family regulatory protein
MPIYEYEALYPDRGCALCGTGFEIIQSLSERPLSTCPDCGGPVRKLVSLCRAAVMETSPEHARVQRQISDYEKAGMWSHAAELADKHAEKVKDKGIRLRAVENYAKAGYDSARLDKHINSE